MAAQIDGHGLNPMFAMWFANIRIAPGSSPTHAPAPRVRGGCLADQVAREYVVAVHRPSSLECVAIIHQCFP